MAIQIATLGGQTLAITARNAGQQLWFNGAATTAATAGQRLRVAGDGPVILGEGWWDQLLIVNDVTYPGDYFDGDTPATVDPVAARIERSDNNGATWTTIANNLPLGAGVGDDEVPLNTSPLYRAVSISDLGVEQAGDPVTVTTGTSRVWLQSDAGKMYILGAVDLAPNLGSERTVEDYWEDEYPTAHYGRGSTERVQVSGSWYTPEDLAQDPKVALGRDVFYRDPAGRAWWGTVGNMQGSQPWAGRYDLSFEVERVTHG